MRWHPNPVRAYAVEQKFPSPATLDANGFFNAEAAENNAESAEEFAFP